MKRKKESHNETHEHSIDKTALVLSGFIIFVLAFASLGGGKSFRSERTDGSVLGSQDMKSSQQITDEINEDFIQEYMPYLKR